jgi:hypothetical protein
VVRRTGQSRKAHLATDRQMKTSAKTSEKPSVSTRKSVGDLRPSAMSFHGKEGIGRDMLCSQHVFVIMDFATGS